MSEKLDSFKSHLKLAGLRGKRMAEETDVLMGEIASMGAVDIEERLDYLDDIYGQGRTDVVDMSKEPPQETGISRAEIIYIGGMLIGTGALVTVIQAVAK